LKTVFSASAHWVSEVVTAPLTRIGPTGFTIYFVPVHVRPNRFRVSTDIRRNGPLEPPNRSVTLGNIVPFSDHIGIVGDGCVAALPCPISIVLQTEGLSGAGVAPWRCPFLLLGVQRTEILQACANLAFISLAENSGWTALTASFRAFGTAGGPGGLPQENCEK
jgi:hypothetical protein